MDLSIIIVSFNTKELLADCLNSIKTAIKNLKVEVFVIDNHSFDGTIQMVKKNYLWVNLIENKINVGFSKANNQALKIAKGKYILILNPDTKLFPDTISKMIKFMDANQDTAVSTCKVQLPNGQLDKDCRRHFPTPWRAFTHFSGLSKIFPHSKLFDQYYLGYLSENKEHEIDSCVGAFMFVRTSAIKKAGYFDEDFFFYGEDLDWCWRFKEAGYRVIFTPITKIVHYKGAASGIKSHTKHLSKATRESKIKVLKESIRAMELFYKKHYLEKYPSLINLLILSSIKTLGQIRILKAYL